MFASSLYPQSSNVTANELLILKDPFLECLDLLLSNGADPNTRPAVAGLRYNLFSISLKSGGTHMHSVYSIPRYQQYYSILPQRFVHLGAMDEGLDISWLYRRSHFGLARGQTHSREIVSSKCSNIIHLATRFSGLELFLRIFFLFSASPQHLSRDSRVRKIALST